MYRLKQPIPFFVLCIIDKEYWPLPSIGWVLITVDSISGVKPKREFFADRLHFIMLSALRSISILRTLRVDLDEEGKSSPLNNEEYITYTHNQIYSVPILCTYIYSYGKAFILICAVHCKWFCELFKNILQLFNNHIQYVQCMVFRVQSNSVDE